MIDLSTILNNNESLSNDVKNELENIGIKIDDSLKNNVEEYLLNKYKLNKINPMFKGMWHRPFEKNITEVRETLKNYSELGFNHLFVETFFNGRVIYKSNQTEIKIHEFIDNYGTYGKNLLKAFIMEGKTYGIHIHAWVENFFIGRYDDIDKRDDLYAKDMLLKNIDNTYLQKNEKNYLFLDPANSEVRDLLANLYQEITDVDGLFSLHLDYIRYPLCYDLDHKNLVDDTGYTDVAINEFEKIHQIVDMKKMIKQNAHIFELWKTYKQEKITRFVERIYLITNHKTKISTAVFGNPEHAIEHKMQNWYEWVDKELVDIVMPMAYYKDASRVFLEIKNMKKLLQRKAIVIAGLAPSFVGLHPLSTIVQIDFSLEAQADGICLFATQNYLVKHFMKETKENIKYIDLFKQCLK